MIIRHAVQEDVPIIFALAKKMYEESAYNEVCSFDDKKSLALIQSALDNPDYYFLRVAEKDGAIIGMYGGFVTDYYFSNDLMAADLLLYVDPNKRGGLAAVKLIQAFEDWAFAKGAKEVCPASSTQIAPERTAQLYHLLGYEVVGNLFKKRK